MSCCAMACFVWMTCTSVDFSAMARGSTDLTSLEAVKVGEVSLHLGFRISMYRHLRLHVGILQLV
jgi:hypothetical protein